MTPLYDPFDYEDRLPPITNQHARSICKQGFQYYRANGVERDYGIAFKYFSAAADGGDEIGLYGLGLCYSWGHGVALNDDRAFELFSLSGAKGYAPALHLSGYFF
jgi:uncharacterized protein